MLRLRRCLCRRPQLTRPLSTNGDPVAYCKDLLRKHDYESFLISHFYPPATQRGYLALKAFSVELAMIQDNVSSPLIGKMRMQFWRDAVRELAHNKPPKHPIALALSELFQRGALQTYHLKRIVDARDAELENPTHMTLDSLTSHAESTSSTLLYALLSLPPTSPASHSTLFHSASHLGTAQTLTTLLRALPFHAAQRRMVIPSEITARHALAQEEVFRNAGGETRGLRDAVWELASVAEEQIRAARAVFAESKGKVPKEAMPVFLSAVAPVLFLERLEKKNFDIYHPSLRARDWRLPWGVWKSYYKRTF